MQENLYWVLGFITGLLIVVTASIIIRVVVKKKNGTDKAVEYDERQVLARGTAYSTAFFTSLIYMILCAMLDVMEIKWAELNVQMFLGLFLSVTVFASICILKDAYFTASSKKLPLIVMFLLATVLNLFAFIMNIADGESMITNGILNGNTINAGVAVMFIIILIVTIIKSIIDRKAVEEE